MELFAKRDEIEGWEYLLTAMSAVSPSAMATRRVSYGRMFLNEVVDALSSDPGVAEGTSIYGDEGSYHITDSGREDG